MNGYTHTRQHFLLKVPKKLEFSKYKTTHHQNHLINWENQKDTDRPVKPQIGVLWGKPKPMGKRFSKQSRHTTRDAKDNENNQQVEVGANPPTLF